jgi:hypothetical protein
VRRVASCVRVCVCAHVEQSFLCEICCKKRGALVGLDAEASIQSDVAPHGPEWFLRRLGRGGCEAVPHLPRACGESGFRRRRR